MDRALELARRAELEGEVPVGAVLVKDGEMLGEGWNQCISKNDPTAHAEVLALRQAANLVSNYRLPGTSLYVTLEPCSMCAGAIVHARVDHVIFAALDEKTGAGGSVINILNSPQLNHKCRISHGIKQAESSQLLRDFFKAKRSVAMV